ncbi:MAG: hypothetical protein KatS3mg076_1166 [Candidatus Binatia bacterium]|nr:MAG: hypothetical protein KatS3mg076_1166 [Candidatus Binatia bacterium]
MRCPRIARELTAFVEGQLAPRRARRVAAHLARCASCSREERSLRRTVVLLQQVLSGPPPELGPYFETRLEARLAEARLDPGPAARRWLPFRWKPVAVLAAAFLAVLLAAGTLAGPEAILVPLGVQPPPHELVERPDLYLEYPIIKRLDELEHFETVDTLPFGEETSPERRSSA